jgi:subtilisin family serine protease
MNKTSLRILLLLGVLATFLVVGSGEPAANNTELKVSSAVMTATSNGADTSFVIVLDDQADLERALSMTDADARGWYVYNTLKRHAAETQAAIKAKLDAEGAQYKSYWAVNMIVTSGDRQLVNELAARNDVGAIESNQGTDGTNGEEDAEAVEAPDAATPGVVSTQAQPLWNLNFKGQGIVVANQDTGMRWTHAALRTHYRGWGGTVAASDHNYNWHDSVHAKITGSDGGTPSGTAANSCGYNVVAPCDDQGHGTHTTGTTIGDDAGSGLGTGTNQVGVAPSAKWIGCRNMDAGNGRAQTYTECFQFFLAPTRLDGSGADPTLRPHVMNNSWGCPLAGELCPRTVLKTIVENSVASGIFVVASAGNDGSACSTVQDPPGIYEASFSVGAVSTSNTAPSLASFSSRGTVTSDASNRMKPDISAPGVSVTSSTRTSDTSYGSMQGTSMASPHVVGTVALLWSARPALVRDIPRTQWLLTRSANRAGLTVPNNSAGCGGIAPTPNNHFGWGRVDVNAAYNLEPSLNQTITFPAISATYGDADIPLNATASSQLPVSYAASGACTVAGGSLHITGAGPCSVTASQAGLDAYSIAATAPKPWYPAANVTQSITIAQASQTITFGALADKTYGDLDFPVSATASSNLPVSFGAAGNCTVLGSTVHITGAGSCTVTASQAGDTNYAAAADVSQTFAIAKAAQSISFAALADKTWGDGDFSVAATSSSGLAVSFAAAGDCSLSGASVHITGAGSCAITASQAGDDNYEPAADVVRSFAIAKANQTIAFGALADKTWGDADFAVSATSSSGLDVSFTASGGCTVSGGSVHITAVGTCTITAHQSGNGNYNAAPNVARSFNVAWTFRGFFQPIDNGLVNVANAGSAIPVKFNLGGNRGLAILASGSPSSTKVACSSGAAEDAVEQTVTAGGSSLAYDATGAQYVYVWKTDGAWQGTCRQLTVKLSDNTSHTATFRFK